MILGRMRCMICFAASLYSKMIATPTANLRTDSATKATGESAGVAPGMTHGTPEKLTSQWPSRMPRVTDMKATPSSKHGHGSTGCGWMVIKNRVARVRRNGAKRHLDVSSDTRRQQKRKRTGDAGVLSIGECGAVEGPEDEMLHECKCNAANAVCSGTVSGHSWSDRKGSAHP